MMVLQSDLDSFATRDRFWSKVRIADGCWEWQAYRQKGYGRFWMTPERYSLAHRFAVLLDRGPFPDELCVLHRCDNPPCCNPEHLFLGTNYDNTLDKIAKGRARRGSQVGELHSQSKLTAEQVMEIRVLWASGEWTQVALGERFGVFGTAIGRIVNGQRWPHLPLIPRVR